jgi:GDPmannose 4,6-dehydratase
MSKVALITGITGQDGSYLASFLLEKGYIVHGIKRRTSLINTERIDDIYYQYNNNRFFLHYGDLSDTSNIIKIVKETCPDEIYNLGAMSHVQVSFESPEFTANVDGLGIIRILEAVRILGMSNKTRIYQASTSELYGKVHEIPQTEKTPFHPRSPYAVSKMFAHWMMINYREAYNMFCSNGILFNHESPVRGETFVTRKITRAIAEISTGKITPIKLGNISAKRDWGHAKDYTEAMWLILQHPFPDDFVIATGACASVRDFLRIGFSVIGIDLVFEGSGLDEKGIVSGSIHKSIPTGTTLVEIDKKYFRPAEVDLLVGDASKARKQLNWHPKYDLNKIIEEMILSDIKKISDHD